MKARIKALFLAAEAEPFIKVGGLGDVAGSLPSALLETGQVEARLVIPFYGAIPENIFPVESVASFDIPHLSGYIKAHAFVTKYNDLTVYLISGNPIAPDAPVYSTDPSLDGHKFTFFSLAALKLADLLDWEPDILHANDWHTVPAVYAHYLGKEPKFNKTVTVFGLHNLPYMGAGAGEAMNEFGLPPASDARLPLWARNIPLPIGLLAADHIVAPSPTYTDEILTQEYGLGLEDFLATRTAQTTGILNGLDISRWNPQTDPFIPYVYNLDEAEKKALNKQDLAAELGINPDPRLPLIGVVSRLDAQKGIDLVPSALNAIAEHPWQAVFLASGDPALEAALRDLERQYPDRIRAVIRYDARLSHRIYAAADFLLIPSRYEPCGLTQMIAMRYGCIPIARATGGLKDTVIDYNQTSQSTGFLFNQPDSTQLAEAILRALRVFNQPATWLDLQRRAMSQDFSWAKSAGQYAALYNQLSTSRQKSRKPIKQLERI